MPGRRAPAEVRFWEKVDVRSDDECWPWLAQINKGHGIFRVSTERRGQAHRFAYELAKGPIPEGLDIDHTCHNIDPDCPGGNDCLHRRCMNPAHLEAVTRQVNLLRGKTAPAENASKTECPYGHPYSGDNLYEWRGMRSCKTCRRARNRDWWARHRKAA